MGKNNTEKTQFIPQTSVVFKGKVLSIILGLAYLPYPKMLTRTMLNKHSTLLLHM